MGAPVFEPTRLDVQAFSAHAGELDGRWPLTLFERLADSAPVERRPGTADSVVWHARGEQLAARDGTPEIWLHLRASTTIALECRRCLEPVEVPLQVDTRLRFVRGEDAAAELDAESEYDVLPLTRSLDLQTLIEDELLLALPVLPAHEVCPHPLPAVFGEPDVEAPSSPFAALADLKRRGKVN
jgi:uncharacterized protein